LKEWGKVRKVFQTANVKKTTEPTWNESFQLYATSNRSPLCIRACVLR
jgi:Ca2+-dependent lipid-binding protein